MFKKRFARLTQIVTGQRGSDGEDLLTLETGLTRLERFVHFWVLVTQSFIRNRCPIRASALSYTTLLALIPMLAVAMSVTSIFLKAEGKDQIEHFIQQFVDYMIPQAVFNTNSAPAVAQSDMPVIKDANPFPTVTQTNLPGVTVSLDGTNTALASVTGDGTSPPANDRRVAIAQKQAAAYIHDFIQNTYSGTLGVTGIIFLLLTAILTLTRIEEAFNDIWGVTRGRNWLARVVQYWTTISLGPLLLVAALGIAGGSRFQQTRAFLNAMPYVETLIAQVLPLTIICLSFALFYKLVPNTKVHFSAALVGGAIAGTAWHFYNMLTFLLASRAVAASKIYGGLALVPLFMGGLYVVWLTVLFGAQVAYAYQNRAAYLQDRLVENVNQRGREFVALRLMTCIGQRYQRGLPPPTITQISTELGVPSRLVAQVLQVLMAARLVAEVSRGEAAYAPARPLDAINAHQILVAMRSTVGQEVVTRDEPVRAEVLGEFARIQEAERFAASSVTMLSLVNRAQARLELASPQQSDKPAPLIPTFAATAVAAGIMAKQAEAAPVVELSNEPEVSTFVPEQKEIVVTQSQQAGTPPEVASESATATSSSGNHESFPL